MAFYRALVGGERRIVPALLLACASSVVFADPLPPPPERPQLDPNGVDVQTGDFAYSATDASIGGKNVGALAYTRYYNGSTGWRDNFSGAMDTYVYNFGRTDQAVSFGNRAEYFTDFVSSQQEGSSASPGSYAMKDGVSVTYGTNYAYNQNSDFTQSYDVISAVSFPNGVIWTYHNKTAAGGGMNHVRTQSITTNTGYQIKFTYSSNSMTSDPASPHAWTKITKVTLINNAYEYCDPMADSCALTMTWPEAVYSSGTGGAHYATDASGNQTRYTEGGTSTTSFFKVKTPDSSTDNIVYNTEVLSPYCMALTSTGSCYIGNNRRVTSVTINGITTNYSYNLVTSTKVWTVTATGPSSTQWQYKSRWDLPSITSVTDPLSRTSVFTNNIAGKLLTATAPETNYSTFSYDGKGNVLQTVAYPKSGSGLSSLSETRTYDANCPSVCDKPLTITDAKGNVTTFTYASHGGVLTETSPAVNGVQPVKRYSYAERYAWTKNSSGSYVQAAFPVWVLTEMRTCRTTATVSNACAGGSSDEVVTSYDYGPNSGPNNLWLRGQMVSAGGTTVRTCYGYDRFGNRISETSPRAGLSTCS